MLPRSPRRCPACAADNPAHASECASCAAPLRPDAGAEGAERKQVSALFCDLTGFTELSEKLDPEEVRTILAAYFGAAGEIVARYGGRIEKFVGDAVMALFGVPVAHEDDPGRALRAALELHRAVAALAPGIRARTGAELSLHSGVNTGVVVTGELHVGGGTAGPLGDTINVAARLMGLAPAGEIWVGPRTRRLAGPAFAFDDVRGGAMKGKAQPMAVSRLRGLLGPAAADAAGEARRRAGFVGRRDELSALLEAVGHARAGRARVVGVRGEAGSGKTRLMHELRARAGHGVRWLQAGAQPHAQNIPHAPLIDLFSRAWGIAERDPPSAVRDKLAAGLRELGMGDDAPALGLLLHLYDVAPPGAAAVERESFQPRLLAAVRRLLQALAARGPTVVCLQDLHWVDPSTDSLLRALAADVPLGLLLANFRPGYEPPAAMTVLDLGELTSHQTRELLAGLLGHEPPEALAGFVAERSDGNPFYAEEVVTSLVETGALVRDGDEGWRLARAPADAGVPATVHGVIAARIDRLDDACRGVLRRAAVVGREFLHGVVAQVCEALQPREFDARLAELQSADLIRLRRSAPEPEYGFRHALTHDVAYEGLLRSERLALHARTARVIETVFADRLPEFVETLAHHWQRGGVAAKAIHYAVLAGRKCVARYALDEAESHFRAAYATATSQPASDEGRRALTALLIAWSQVFYYRGAIAEWRRLLETHLSDAQAGGDAALEATYLGWLGNVRSFAGDLKGATDVLVRGAALARSAGARAASAHIHAWRGFTRFDQEGPPGAIDETAACELTADELRADPYPDFKARCARALALAWNARLRESRELSEGVIAFGRETGNARAEALAHYSLSMHWLAALDFAQAASVASAGVDAARDPLFAACNAVPLAIACMAMLQVDEAEQVCRTWMPHLEQQGNDWFLAMLAAAAGSAEMGRGRLSDGLRRLVRAREIGEQRGWGSTRLFIHCLEMLTLASVARLDLRPSAAALLANPWFTLTQAPLAARRAWRLAGQARAQASSYGMPNMLNLVDLAEGRLLARRDRAAARERVERIAARLLAQGVDPRPTPVAALAAEIDAGR